MAVRVSRHSVIIILEALENVSDGCIDEAGSHVLLLLLLLDGGWLCYCLLFSYSFLKMTLYPRVSFSLTCSFPVEWKKKMQPPSTPFRMVKVP